MSKLLLVNTNIEKAPYPVPPLGLCLLAAQLEKNFEVKIYDGVFDEGKSLHQVLISFNPDYIGFSIRNIDDVVADRHIFYVPQIISDFIQPVKKYTDVPIILGGSGFSMFPSELMEMTGADYGIIGEGEHSLSLLLDRLDKKEDLTNIPGLIDRSYKKAPVSLSKSRQIFQSGFAEMDRRIDFTPYLQKSAYSIQTKRGCSHACIYCTYPVIEGNLFRIRSTSDIADEIEQVYKRLGTITFEFVDSTFNHPIGHAEAICREIIKRKIKVHLRTMGINPRNVSDELFELMLEAGFTQIDATPDSASGKVLKLMGKGFQLREVEKMAMLIRKFDIPAMWFFLFSGPGEDEKTFAETMNFIDSYVNPDDLVYMNAGLRIYPETPLYQIALNEGRFTPGQSMLYPPVYYFSENLGKDKVDKMISEAVSNRPHCLPSNDTKPSPELIREAMELRKGEKLSEPMFRTLLKIRKKWILDGRLQIFNQK